jgi:hypothetical protein
MRILVLFLLASLSLAFYSDSTSTSKVNSSIKSDDNSIKFYDQDKRVNTIFQVVGTYHSEFEISSKYAFKIDAANIYLRTTASDMFLTSEIGDIFLSSKVGNVNINNTEIDKDGVLSAKGYKSNSGAIGKTYTEEFEDKQGNIRTRVYENGLLVSYKINGVEQ